MSGWLDSLSEADRAAVMEERRQELESFWPVFGDERMTIRAYPLLHVDKPNARRALIRATDDMELRLIVEAFGKCFRRELRFDSPPFSAKLFDWEGRPNTAEVVLFDSQNMTATFPIAAGAAGLSMVQGRRMLDWIWLHPYERGRHLMEYAWADLEQVYGNDFLVQTPLSGAMRAFLVKQNVDPERWQG